MACCPCLCCVSLFVFVCRLFVCLLCLLVCQYPVLIAILPSPSAVVAAVAAVAAVGGGGVAYSSCCSCSAEMSLCLLS